MRGRRSGNGLALDKRNLISAEAKLSGQEVVYGSSFLKMDGRNIIPVCF
jgi:hypothetical protein